MPDERINLSELCLDKLATTLSSDPQVVCGPSCSKPHKEAFKDSEGSDTHLPQPLAQRLLALLCDTGRLDDNTLAVFNSLSVTMTTVSIRDAADISEHTLRAVMSGHRTKKLEFINTPSLTRFPNQILGCIGRKNFENLRMLVLAHYAENTNRVRGFHETFLDDKGIGVIAELASRLECLDITGNLGVTSFSPLTRLQQLKSLVVCNCENLRNASVVHVLESLPRLTHLDVSVKRDGRRVCVRGSAEPGLADMLLGTVGFNRHLVSLDLSGRSPVSEDLLRCYLEAHPSLRFVGLWRTNACHFSLFRPDSPDYNPKITVTGTTTLKQALETLRRYDRHLCVNDVIADVARLSEDVTEPRPDIVQAVTRRLQRMRASKCIDRKVLLPALTCLATLTWACRDTCTVDKDLTLQLVRLTLDVHRRCTMDDDVQWLAESVLISCGFFTDL